MSLEKELKKVEDAPSDEDADKQVEMWKVRRLIQTLEAARGNGTLSSTIYHSNAQNFDMLSSKLIRYTLSKNSFSSLPHTTNKHTYTQTRTMSLSHTHTLF